MASPMSSPAPAAWAAGPTAANTPAPIIEPRPMTTASPSPRRRASLVGAAATVSSAGCPAGSTARVVVVPYELDLEPALLPQERRVHAGEVALMGRLARFHACRHQSLVVAVDVVGAEPEVPEVDVGIGRAPELDLQPRRRVGDEREVLGPAFDDHAEGARQAVHMGIEVGHGQGDVIDPGRDHRQPPAGWNSSTRFPEGSTARTWAPPGPVTISLRNLTPSSLRRSTSRWTSSTMRWMRFQPPGPGRSPSDIGLPAELIGPDSSRRRLPLVTSAKAGLLIPTVNPKWRV